MNRRIARLTVLLAGVLAAGLLNGCGSALPLRCLDHEYPPAALAADKQLDFGPYAALPKPRLGALPFPGMFTLYTTADPDNLGNHRYSHSFGETERGILYTRRAGFIDISHVRKAADLTVYVQARLEHALLHDYPCVQMRSREPSVYHISFDYPPFWSQLDPTEKQELAHEMSIRLGQRLAFLMMTWHEVITWFGYKSWGVISEYNSAFAHDDTTTHMVGVITAGRALRDDQPYDEAMTEQLDEMLAELQVVDGEGLAKALDASKGRWWDRGAPLRRHVETDPEHDTVTPWVVPEMLNGAEPAVFTLQDVDAIDGRPFGTFYHVQISPKVMESGKIRRLLPGEPKVIEVDQHLPIILEHIRQQVRERYGEDADQP